MSKDHLPKQVDPIRLADSTAELKGSLPIKSMSRLVDSLMAPDGDAAVNLQFGVDRQGFRHIKGQVQATLTLQCQRCLQPFPYEIVSDFQYGLVDSEKESSLLPGYYDPVVVQEGTLHIPDMVEEELIVNLPIVSMHDPNDCEVKLPLFVAGDEATQSATEKASPFKVIESLKANKQKE
jgi:uncharacterized protein